MASLLSKILSPESDDELTPEVPEQFPSEWEQELVPDAPPGKSKAPKIKLTPTRTSGNVTPALKKRIAAEVEAYVEFAALPLVLRDPECGGALHEQAKPIGDAIAQILSRYPDLAHKFLQTGVLGDWLKLAAVLQPFLKAVYDHHIAKKPEEEQVDDRPDYVTSYPSFRPGS
jgi:hypothetical protein